MKIQSQILYIAAFLMCAVQAMAVQPAARRLPDAHTKSAGNLAYAKPTPFVNDAFENARLNSPFTAMAVEELAQEAADDAMIADMTKFAASLLGTRYRLGTSGPKSFDCSGFTSYVFRNFGITLNRDSRSQYLQGEKVGKDELRPGDLMFFSSSSSGRGRVGHVAMVSEVHPDGSCTFIHASTKYGVTYQKFPDGGYYSRHYIGARRIIGTPAFAAK